MSRKRSNKDKKKKQEVFVKGGNWTISKLFSTLKLRFWTMARDAATPLRMLYSYFAVGLNPFCKDHSIVGSYEIIMKSKTTFDDVKGVTEAKAELEEFVQYLKDPKQQSSTRTAADSTRDDAQTLVPERKAFEGNVADLETLAALRKSRITIKEPTGMNDCVNVKKNKRGKRK